MKKKQTQKNTTTLVLIGLLAAVSVFALVYFAPYVVKPAIVLPIADETPGSVVTVTGEVACLPHKDKNGPQTAECAIGVKVGSHYYGLQNAGPGTLEINSQATFTGKFTPVTSGETYDIVGTIEN